jgi:hypothetical protein
MGWLDRDPRKPRGPSDLLPQGVVGLSEKPRPGRSPL